MLSQYRTLYWYHHIIVSIRGLVQCVMAYRYGTRCHTGMRLVWYGMGSIEWFSLVWHSMVGGLASQIQLTTDVEISGWKQNRHVMRTKFVIYLLWSIESFSF